MDPVSLIHHPETLAPAFEVAVIGDIRIDIRARLDDHRFVDLSVDEQSVTSMTSEVGGTAMNVAQAAAAHFTIV